MTPLSSAEAHRFLKAVAGTASTGARGCRNIPDHWYAQQCPVPIVHLARIAGVGERTLKYAIDGERHVARGDGDIGHSVPGIGEPTLIKLSPVIRAIEDGLLVFVKRGGRWHDVWLDRPFVSGRQESIVDDDDWDYWRRCSRCAGRKWLPIEMNGKARVACYVCFLPSQYRAIGAAPRSDRLVERVIEGIEFDQPAKESNNVIRS